MHGGLAYVNCDQGRLVVLQRAMGDQEIADAARSLVASFDEPSNLKTTAASLVALGANAVPPLLSAMHDSDSVVRLAASHVLSFIQPRATQVGPTTTAWVAAIKDRRGKHHAAPILYVRRVFANLRLPRESQAAIVDALISQLSSEDDSIRNVTKNTLIAIGRKGDLSRHLVKSRLNVAQSSRPDSVEIAATILREIPAEHGR